MDISSDLSVIMQANALHAVRTTMSAAKAAPSTPGAQADVILQLSTAAQQLMQSQGTVSHPSA